MSCLIRLQSECDIERTASWIRKKHKGVSFSLLCDFRCNLLGLSLERIWMTDELYTMHWHAPKSSNSTLYRRALGQGSLRLIGYTVMLNVSLQELPTINASCNLVNVLPVMWVYREVSRKTRIFKSLRHKHRTFHYFIFHYDSFRGFVYVIKDVIFVNTEWIQPGNLCWLCYVKQSFKYSGKKTTWNN